MTEALIGLRKKLAWMARKYEENEERNSHTENYLMLATAFGTDAELARVQEIAARHKSQGFMDPDDYKWLFDNINLYHGLMRRIRHDLHSQGSTDQ